jgi:serine/threonine-protein kinase
MTVTGMALGTPAYMAPEQAVGDRNIDHRADLYALGVVAYEMLSGVHPFGSRSPQALVAAHLTEAPTPLHDRRPEVPAALGRLVMQLLAKDPAARPRDAATVVRTLDALMTSAMPVLPISGRSRRGTRRTTMVLATVLVVAAGYIAWRRSGSGDASSAAPIGTLAVLPFENTGSDANDEYFSSGITDELAHALAQLPGLRIAGRTSTYALKGRNLSAQEIGRALDVAAIISGTVQRAGDRLRVTTQLVSTRDGKVLWDSVYESRSRDVFAVQDEFTRAVAATLSRSLGDRPAVATPVGVARGTSSEEAYDLFLKGQFFYMSRGQANVAQSIAYFQKAIAVDPRFARAHAALANAYAVLRVYAPDPRDSLALLARASANRAMALDSTLAMSQAAMAQSQMTSLQFDSSEVHFRRALALDPTSGETHLAFGFQQLATGHTDVAIREFQEAVRLDPLVKSAHSALAMALVFARRFPEAIAESRRLVAVDSTFPLSYLPLALAQAAGGHGDSAVVTLERSAPYNRTAPQRRAFLMFAYAAAGRWTDVARMRVELSAMGAAAPAADRAFADLLLGDPEPIVRLLSTEKGRREWATVNWFGCSPLLDPLWHDARFRATMDALHVEPCALARPWPFDRHAPGRS